MANQIRLTGAVMSHPRRTAPARALIGSAPEGFLDLVLDPDPSGPPTGLRTSIRAWSEIPAGSTHHLVLEDDAQLCAGFRLQAERAAAAAPHAAITLFNNWSSRNGAVVRIGALSGARWARPVAEYTANVALILPAEVGAGFADYARAHGGTWPDDVVLARYLRSEGVPTYLTVPNLVEHGEFPSISGNDAHGLRRSACCAVLPPDADWSLDNLIEPEAVPFFKFGVAQCSIRHGTGWLTVGGDRGFRRLGVDVDRCAKELDLALSPASPASPTAGRLPARTVVELWRTGYALGLLTARHESAVPWAGDPLVHEALDTLGPGGLCMERGAAELRSLREPLRELARAAVSAGAHQPEIARSGRRILVTGADLPLRRTLVDDLRDRGHHVRTADRASATDGDAADTVVELVAPGPPTAMSLRCRTAAGDGSAPVTAVLRLGLPYGPEITDGSPMNELVRRSLMRQPMRARGALPEAVRFAHVWDIAQALARLIDRPARSGSFDVCHDEVVGPAELGQLIARTIRPVELDPRPATEPAAPPLHNRRTRAELGWRPSVDLAEGIRTVAQWLAYEEE